MAEVWRGDRFVGGTGRGPDGDKRLSVSEAKRLYNVLDYLRFKGVPIPSDARKGDWTPIRCPFHGDTHASASVHTNLNRFRCHACDVGGDILDVVAVGEDLDVRGAIQWLMKNLPRRY